MNVTVPLAPGDMGLLPEPTAALKSSEAPVLGLVSHYEGVRHP